MASVDQPIGGRPAGQPAGVIHDIGYQRYTGPRLGRAYALTSLYTHSLRTAFGLGRRATAKIFPWLAVALVLVVAVVAVVVRSQTNTVVIGYLQFSDGVSIIVLLFLAVAAPELVSRDLRAKVLPLYFSRPLRRGDYGVVKLAATTTSVWLMLAGPLLLMYIGGLFSIHGAFRVYWRETTNFLGGLGYAAVVALVFSAVAVPIASLAGRRAVAAASIVATFLVTAPVVGVLQAVGGTTAKQLSPVLNPVSLVQGLRSYVFQEHNLDLGSFGPMYVSVSAAIVIGSVWILLARYRKVAA
jgi:ABC-2 type transport system permease protein